MPLSYKQILQFIFPPSADERQLLNLPKDIFNRPPLLRHSLGHALLPYTKANVRAAIHLAKFHHHTDALHLLGTALAAYTATHPVDLIIPIPLSAKRYRERGYNQVVEIIKAALKINPTIKYNDRCLVRKRNTRPQTELDKESRLHNLKGAFAINSECIPQNIADLHIMIIDDVLTTGTTMEAAWAELIKCKPKSITCVALAH